MRCCFLIEKCTVKVSIPIRRHVPIASTAHSTVHALVFAGTSILLTADYDLSWEKIGPSVTGEFKIGTCVGDSLFSGGKNGQGYHTVSLHDGTFEHSTRFHHFVKILNYWYDTVLRDIPVLSEEGKNLQLLESNMPYELPI